MKRVLPIFVFLIFLGPFGNAYADTIFQDDFEDGTIDQNLWHTNNLGWYGYTAEWVSQNNREESGGILTITGKGDYIPMEILVDADPGNIIYHFSIMVGDSDNGGVVIAEDPYSSFPLSNSLSFSLVTSNVVHPSNNYAIHISHFLDGELVDGESLFPGVIEPNTWYEVDLAISTNDTQTTIQYSINNIGSGIFITSAIPDTYISTIYGRGAWGVNADVYFDDIHLETAPEPVTIDIKPGSKENCLNINGHGIIPVAILGSADFDVSNIDIASLLFNGLEVQVRGNKEKTMCHLEDVSGDFTYPEGVPDGYLDLVCQFEDDPTQWIIGHTDAKLTGELYDGTLIEGDDAICIVP